MHNFKRKEGVQNESDAYVSETLQEVHQDPYERDRRKRRDRLRNDADDRHADGSGPGR